MAITQNKPAVFLGFLLVFFPILVAKGQDSIAGPAKTNLIPYLLQLENKFDIKFSYVDEDLANITVTPPESTVLNEILDAIGYGTQIKIQKLNNRYYTLSNTQRITICGTILDNFEQNTIPGATVQILNDGIATVTDLDGGFILENVSRNAKIHIKHIGFKPMFIDAQDFLRSDPCKVVAMSLLYQQLQEVVVFDFLTKGLVQRLDASIELNSRQFGILPGLSEPDVLQTVQALPGIKSIDETVSDINIRGGSNDQNLILWDEIKMYQSGHFFGLISAFNPYLTDKVTVVKNGTSARYGDGVSGLIDMRTKDDINTDYFGGAGFNMISGDVFGQLSLSKDLAVQISARRSTTDFFDSPTFDTFFNRAFKANKVVGNSTQISNLERDDSFYFYDFAGKVLFDINEDHRFRASFININNLLDYTERDTESSLWTKSALDQTNLSFGGTLASRWNERLATTINAYYTKYDLDAENISAQGDQVLFQGNGVLETSAKLAVDYQLSNGMVWHNGYQIAQTGITNITRLSEPDFFSDAIDIVNANSLFSELVYEAEDRRIYFRGGLRLNHLQNPGNFDTFLLEPRLAVNVEIAKNLKAVFLGEFKSQATNQVIDLEQNFLGIEKRRWVVSDGNALPVAQSRQGSLGLNYDSRNLYIGLEAFNKQVNGISTTTQGFQNQNQFNGEIGKYEVHGLEFLVNKKSNDYSLWASYSYNVNNYTFADFDPPNFPNNLDIRHTATLAGTYTLKGFRFGLGVNYRTGKPYTRPHGDNPVNNALFPAQIVYGEANTSRLPEYLRADASFIYDFDWGRRTKASIGASVLNFTDRNNLLNIFYRLDENDAIETVESTSLGMTPNFSFRLTF